MSTQTPNPKEMAELKSQGGRHETKAGIILGHECIGIFLQFVYISMKGARSYHQPPPYIDVRP